MESPTDVEGDQGNFVPEGNQTDLIVADDAATNPGADDTVAFHHATLDGKREKKSRNRMSELSHKEWSRQCNDLGAVVGDLIDKLQRRAPNGRMPAGPPTRSCTSSLPKAKPEIL